MSDRLLGHSLARLSLLAVIGFGLGGCAAADRLAGVGQPPVLSSIEDPTAQPGYKPVRMPMPNPAARVLRVELAVAAGLARLLQGPARASRSAISSPCGSR